MRIICFGTARHTTTARNHNGANNLAFPPRALRVTVPFHWRTAGPHTYIKQRATGQGHAVKTISGGSPATTTRGNVFRLDYLWVGGMAPPPQVSAGWSRDAAWVSLDDRLPPEIMHAAELPMVVDDAIRPLGGVERMKQGETAADASSTRRRDHRQTCCYYSGSAWMSSLRPQARALVVAEPKAPPEGKNGKRYLFSEQPERSSMIIGCETAEAAMPKALSSLAPASPLPVELLPLTTPASPCRRNEDTIVSEFPREDPWTRNCSVSEDPSAYWTSEGNEQILHHRHYLQQSTCRSHTRPSLSGTSHST
eukprot:gene24440-biopygen7397